MRIGLISDTHDHVVRIREAMAILNCAAVDVILHAGDIFAISRAFAEVGARLESQWWKTELGSRRVLVMHEPRGVTDVATAGIYDLIVYGDTYQRDLQTIGETTIVNPGEVCCWLGGVGSLAIYDAEPAVVEFHEF